MKMIGHQTITEDIAIWQPVSPDILQKEKVIVAAKEDLLLLIAPVIDMIGFVGEEVHISIFCYQK